MDPNMKHRRGLKRERKWVSRTERIWQGDQSVSEVLRSPLELGKEKKQRLLNRHMGKTYVY